MLRPRLPLSRYPWHVRVPLWLYRACASLHLAVVLIAVYTLVLIWGTFVEGRYGLRAAKFAIYESWWFAVIHALLGLNILCAALVRYPWKRRQTGFVVTHLGLLALLLGCLLSWFRGTAAMLPIFEGHSAWRAYKENRQHFELIVEREGAEATSDASSSNGKGDGEESKARVQEHITIPFVAGPFNWRDYQRLSWFPWHWRRRARGVLYDHEGIRLEVLDYYADSAVAWVPRVTVQVSNLPPWRRWLQALLGAPPWKPVALWWQSPFHHAHAAEHPWTSETQKGGRGEERLDFLVARTQEETDAFLGSQPEGSLGLMGQLVLWAKGKNHPILLESVLTSTKGSRPRFPLGDTGLDFQVLDFMPGPLAVRLRVYHQDDPPQDMTLYADRPELNRQDYSHGVFGTYWFDATERSAEYFVQRGLKEVIREARRPRIDVLQGHDRRLYWRAWMSPCLGGIGELPTDGAIVTVLRETGAPVAMFVEQFEPGDRPGMKMVPLPFDGEKSITAKRPQALVRLTVDGTTEEFWLARRLMQTDPPFEQSPEELQAQEKVAQGQNQRVTIALAPDELDPGFRLYLRQFEKRLIPGTSEDSAYSSWVELLERNDTDQRLESGPQGVEITVNGPATFRDPYTGRTYRLYQEDRAGPWKPGDPLFQKLASGTTRPWVYVSWLKVTEDPGRGLKYAGCLMIVVGIGIIYYMKAYFFGKRAPTTTATDEQDDDRLAEE